MKIAPVQFNYSLCNVKFGGDVDLDDDDIRYTNDTRLRKYGGPFNDSETHPIRVDIGFHRSGKISNIKIDYKNGKYASGTITESYDENGKNINYQV